MPCYVADKFLIVGDTITRFIRVPEHITHDISSVAFVCAIFVTENGVLQPTIDRCPLQFELAMIENILTSHATTEAYLVLRVSVLYIRFMEI